MLSYFGGVIIELRDFIPAKSSLHYYFVHLQSLFWFILVVSKVIDVSLVCSIPKKEGMWCTFSIAYMIYLSVQRFMGLIIKSMAG